MEITKLAKKLEGLHTISSIAKLLNINKRTAINYVSRLRKEGLIKTTYGLRTKARLYEISTYKKREHPLGLYDIVNKYSRVKLAASQEYKIHKELTIEEALIRIVKTQKFRLILASLELFNKVKDWPELFRLAKKEYVGRKIGALYDITRITIKIKKMDKRTRKGLLNTSIKNKYIIKGLKSKDEDIKKIERLWKVYIPFNKDDLDIYKEWRK